jgi:hypothetical protein
VAVQSDGKIIAVGHLCLKVPGVILRRYNRTARSTPRSVRAEGHHQHVTTDGEALHCQRVAIQMTAR